MIRAIHGVTLIGRPKRQREGGKLVGQLVVVAYRTRSSLVHYLGRSRVTTRLGSRPLVVAPVSRWRCWNLGSSRSRVSVVPKLLGRNAGS